MDNRSDESKAAVYSPPVTEPSVLLTTVPVWEKNDRPGRPRGSKNKHPSRRRTGLADPPPQSGEDNDIIHQDFEVVEPLRATSEADEAMQDAEEEEGRQNKPGGPSGEVVPR